MCTRLPKVMWGQTSFSLIKQIKDLNNTSIGILQTLTSQFMVKGLNNNKTGVTVTTWINQGLNQILAK